MKQNSYILFHLRRQWLTIGLATIWLFVVPFTGVAVGQQTVSEYRNHFDPVKGFKPAQLDLSEIYLQVAASLEHYGSPGPYLRHMKKEHERIREAYEDRHGKEIVGYCPSYMSDEYIEKLIGNWDKLAPKIGLAALAREVGKEARLAIRGSDDKGTILIGIFNEYQERVLAKMTKRGKHEISFDDLRKLIEPTLKTGEIPIVDLVAREASLSLDEKAAYQRLLVKDRFTRADFGEIETFYKAIFDKLSDSGKAEISFRTWQGTRREKAESSRRKQSEELVSHADAFKAAFSKLFARLDAGMKPHQAKLVKDAIEGYFLSLGKMAHSELEAGVAEWALDD